MAIINWLNENIVWGVPMLILFLGTGLFFTIKLRFSQFRFLSLLRKTIFKKQSGDSKNNLSPFQTLTSTLAVTLGTGNIVALGTAIALGGAGAVFWMWVSAFLGMATTYAENYFGMKTRRQNRDGTFFGGAFFYIEKAMNKGWAMFFAACCCLTGIGMGNMTQMNALSVSMERTFGTPLWLSGLMGAALIGIMVFGGAKFLGEITEKVIPILSLLYIGGCILVIAVNFREIPNAFGRIFSEAFSLQSMGGGLLGSALIRGMNLGLRRGVFSNEAGLGSSVILNTMSSERSADVQGSWAMLCVFIDTIIVCTLTALVILLTGADQSGLDGTQFASAAFGTALGKYADGFVTISVVMFALATVSGWAVFGRASMSYLFHGKGERLYLIVYVICAFLGAVMSLDVVWWVADLLNGLMAIPNLLSINMLAITQNVRFITQE